jgi:RND family efflux transporter MFP subunit
MTTTLCAPHAVAWGQLVDEFDGFTEPLRVVSLASDETGTIAELLVAEGDYVEKGEPIARLDDRLQRLQLEMARHLASSASALSAAQQTYKKRAAINDQLQVLRRTGHAAESELIRAEMELAIAKSKFLAAEEDMTTRQLELQRAEVMLDRRTVRAPFAGVVSIVHRFPGEYVSPVRPEIVTLAQIDQLLAVFNLPSRRVAGLTVDQPAHVRLASGDTLDGVIHSIGVQTDAQSGTVIVKVRLDNTSGALRSGDQVVLLLD